MTRGTAECPALDVLAAMGDRIGALGPEAPTWADSTRSRGVARAGTPVAGRPLRKSVTVRNAGVGGAGRLHTVAASATAALLLAVVTGPVRSRLKVLTGAQPAVNWTLTALDRLRDRARSSRCGSAASGPRSAQGSPSVTRTSAPCDGRADPVADERSATGPPRPGGVVGIDSRARSGSVHGGRYATGTTVAASRLPAQPCSAGTCALSAASSAVNRASRAPWKRAQSSVTSSGAFEGNPAGHDVP